MNLIYEYLESNYNYLQMINNINKWFINICFSNIHKWLINMYK